MKEIIILAPGANEKELLRTLAANGKNTLGMRILNGPRLAEEALLRSGILGQEEEMSALEKQCLIYALMKEVPYFRSASFSDGANMSRSLETARGLIRRDEEAGMERVFGDGEFPEKNHAVLAVYEAYMEQLKKLGRTDSTAIQRRALAEAKPLEADLVCLQEFPLTPLEEELLKHLSRGTMRTCTIGELAGKEETPLQGVTFDESYGSVNELEHILADIAGRNIPYDRCTIAVADPSYTGILRTLSALYGIPMTFGTGIPITATHAAELFALIGKWEGEGYHGVDALHDIFASSAFDSQLFFETIGAADTSLREREEILNTAGCLKISMDDNPARLTAYRDSITDPKEAERYRFVEALAGEFAGGWVYLLETYTRIRSGRESILDRAGVRTLCDSIAQYLASTENGSVSDIAEELLKRSVCREASQEGHLHVTGLQDSLSLHRGELYIAGLGARLFPGSPTENYLLLDSDFARFEEASAPDSVQVIRRKQKMLNDLLEDASAFGEKIHISYTGFNMKDLKEENPSSVLFEIYRKEYGDDAGMDAFNAAIGHHVYFDAEISSLRRLGRAYNQQRILPQAEKTMQESYPVPVGGRAFSPSAVSVFFECPKRFYLTRILGIPEPEEDDPFQLMKGNEPGLLIHELMEEMARKNLDHDHFMALAEEKFDAFMKKRVPVHDGGVKETRNEFLRMAENGYQTDPHNKVLATETETDTVLHKESGILIKGIPDRVEQRPDGSNIIVDYKTYRKIRNLEDDIDTCLQVVMYAYITEAANPDCKIAECEYRYLQNVRTITCVYDETMKTRLAMKLQELKKALDSGIFEPAEDEEACRYCRLGMICGRHEESGSEEEEE